MCKFCTHCSWTKIYQIANYNLGAIIAVGYRVPLRSDYVGRGAAYAWETAAGARHMGPGELWRGAHAEVGRRGIARRLPVQHRGRTEVAYG